MKYKILVTDPISNTGISILKDNDCKVIDCTNDKSKIYVKELLVVFR